MPTSDGLKMFRLSADELSTTVSREREKSMSVMMEFENDISRSSDSDFNSSPKRVKRRLFASQCASKKVAIEAEKPVSASYIAN